MNRPRIPQTSGVLAYQDVMQCAEKMNEHWRKVSRNGFLRPNERRDEPMKKKTGKGKPTGKKGC